MPIPQTIRINPLDLQGNIAIGVSLPFDGPVAFNSTYSTADQIKSNLINLLLTSKGERLYLPDFGCDLKSILFEGIDDTTLNTLRNYIYTNVSTYIPEITIIEINTVTEEDYNKISITVQYRLNLSGNADEVTIEFI
jgi:phage baseplate assembly protein W